MRIPTFPLAGRILRLVTLAALTASAHAIVDLDGDQQDDVWQEFYGAQTLEADLDEDGDGSTNLSESVAGTDPFDPNSRIAGKNIAHRSGDDSVSITFPTEYGKSYCLEVGASLVDDTMTALPTIYHGTGTDITVTLAADASPSTKGAIAHDVWTGLPAPSPGSTDDATPIVITDDPDATEALADLKSPTNVSDHYLGRMRGWVVPNRSGSHTFYLTACGTAELYLGTNSNPNSATTPIAKVDSQLIAPKQWVHPDATSYTRVLTAGQRYYIEVRHQHGAGGDHCAVGWKQPNSAIAVADGVDVRDVPVLGADEDADPPNKIQLIGGANLRPYTRGEPVTKQLAGAGRMFFKVSTKELDQDGDTITDWAEKQMGGDHNFYFANDKSTASGDDDLTTLTSALAGGRQTVTLTRSDVAAHEDSRNSAEISAGKTSEEVLPDTISFHLNRTGSLQPLAIQYSIGSTGQQSSTPASGSDFTEKDAEGNVISGTLVLPFGHVATHVVLNPIEDNIHEYPEKLRFSVIDAGGPGAGDYDLGTAFEMDATIYDARNVPENERLFVGRSSEDPNHTTTTKGTAIVSGFLNGHKDFMRLNSLIMAPFSSPQNDSHIHKANPGPLNGPIIYEITETPGDPGSDPKIGELLDYPWPIHDIQGSSTGTQVIDGMFSQNGETPIYLNWHTNDNQGGELWAIFGEESGSIEEPDPPVAPPAITVLAGAELERDVRRFLNQASFGATDAEVAHLLNEIATTHASAAVPRLAAFEAWIDNQIDLPQTYMVDYVLAADNQEWKLRGYFDPSRWFTNQFNDPDEPLVDVPDLPAAWPTIDRSRPDPQEWFPAENYPLTGTQINWGKNENRYTFFDLGEPNSNHRRRAHWLFMANANDQLRQKMGYSLQQILVVSESLSRISQDHLAASNYQDMLNRHAFAHFHNLFSFINRSPIMGKWLSSLKNQKAYDINGDSIPDVFPDENLAREDMQLFSIGLFNLWTDGTLKLSEDTGLPEPTYINEDITEFARVLTGQSFSRYANNSAQWGIDATDTGDPFDTNNANGGILFSQNNPTGGTEANRLTTVTNNFGRGEGNKYYNHQFTYPMQMFGDFHDLGVKTMAGGKVIDNTAMSDGDLSQSGGRTDEIAHAEKDLDDAIAWLAGKPGDGLPDYDMTNSHRSTPAFLALRLIQRFTTSNPSSAYLYRVAKAFKDSEGGMTETIKAILLDYEVRELSLTDNDQTVGLKKSPLDLYLQLLRSFSQRYDTASTAFTEGAFSGLPLDVAKPVPGGIAPSPPADGYLANFGYPTSQLSKFTINSRFRYFNTDNRLSMTPFAQETVFNYYLPLYSPGGSVADAGMVAPELQIATETAVIQNVNAFWTITWNTAGQSVNPIGGDPGQNAAGTENKPGNYNQRLLYGDATPDDSHVSDGYDNVRIAILDWALNIIPWGTGAADEFNDITALVDAIDLRLTGGRFATRYAYDPNDNEDAAADGINPTKTTFGDGDLNNDGELKNPREIIVDGLIGMSYNPYSTNSTTAQNAKRDLFRTALYLMSTTPEFVVQK